MAATLLLFAPAAAAALSSLRPVMQTAALRHVDVGGHSWTHAEDLMAQLKARDRAGELDAIINCLVFMLSPPALAPPLRDPSN